MNFGNFLAGGAILGVLASMWQQIRFVALRLIGMLWVTIELSPQTEMLVLRALCDKYKLSRIYTRHYQSDTLYDYADQQYVTVVYEYLGKHPLVFYNGLLPIYYTPGKPEGKSGGGGGKALEAVDAAFGDGEPPLTLTFFRGTINVTAFLQEAAVIHTQQRKAHIARTAQRHSRFRIEFMPRSDTRDPRSTGKGPPRGTDYQEDERVRLLYDTSRLERATDDTTKRLDRLHYDPHVYKVVDEIQHWLDSQEWYTRKEIPWRRGLCLYGPPGTGKTGLSVALASDLNLPLFVTDLTQVRNNAQLRTLWGEFVGWGPCIVLLEDFDNVFHGREYVGPQPSWGLMPQSNTRRRSRSEADQDEHDEYGGGATTGITFDALLNCIDGAQRASGVLLIITTNDITKIDEALTKPGENGEYIGSRPGRIDRCIQLGYTSRQAKMRIAADILLPEAPEAYKRLTSNEQWLSTNHTPAQVTLDCSDIALDFRFNKRLPPLPDSDLVACDGETASG
jgi:hypothetical protein